MTESKDLIIITASCGKNLELSEKFLEKSNELKISSEILDLTTLDIPLFNPRIHTKDNIPVEIEAIKESEMIFGTVLGCGAHSTVYIATDSSKNKYV